MQDIRNIAIIAHVDHGKTTLVDKMMLAGHLFRGDQTNGELVLDNNDLERERGITILSKNVSIVYKDTKINIIDTPGHSDFGGEVERVLNMADGCLLLVDAFEGPMPQTRFVLQKALEMGLKPVVVVNKVDKPNCRPEEVYEMVFDLMCDLNATEEQLDFPVIYGSAKNGWMSADWSEPSGDLTFLLDSILEHIPAPKQLEGTPQMLITSLDYSNYTGRIAVGRVHRGTLREGMNVTIIHRNGKAEKTKIKELHTFTGMGRQKTAEVGSGDICAIVGLDNFEIGDTICDYENPEALPPISIDEPTMSMLFTINDSPFFGKEGKDFRYNALGQWEGTDEAVSNQFFTMTRLLGGGATAPGIVNNEMERKVPDDNAMQIMDDQEAFSAYTQMPFPYYTLTNEQTQTVSAMQNRLGAYVDTMMGRFIIGDVELNDENYAAFTDALTKEYDVEGNLIGDKTASVVFDCSKLKRAVPAYQATIGFEEGVRKCVDYILAHPECQQEDPEFDAWCDKVINALEEVKKQF